MKAIYSRVDRSKELSVFVAEFPLDVLAHFEAGKMETHIEFDFDIESSRHLVIVHISVEVSYDQRIVPLTHNCVFEFLVPDLGNLLTADGLLGAGTLLEFVYESYALARGMIAVRTLGFGIHDFPLPFLPQQKTLDKVEEVLLAKRNS